MISLIDRNDTKAPRFKAKLVAILLRATIKGLATSDIDKLIRNSTYSSGQISALTIHTIKKYLYYLIEYGLILYGGTNQVEQEQPPSQRSDVLSKHDTVTLLCHCKDENHCHRLLVKQMVKEI